MYVGLTRKLGHITLRSDVNERFYSFGYSKERSSLLYCVNKQPLPNIFHCTAFKQHHGFLLNENQKKADFSKMFMFLLSTLDRKEEYLQWENHPIDVSYDELKEYNDDKYFCLADLDNNDSRKHLTKLFYKYMQRVAEISNHNLTRNSDAYMASGGKIDQDNNFSWIDNSSKEGKEKFELSY